MALKEFHRDLGACPVSAENAAGKDPRDGQRFGTLQAQMDRLTDLHATGQVHWVTVVQLAAEVLADEGKDLSVGVWLTVALWHTRQLSGIADGVHVLRDLVTMYWDGMSPPPARLRGRRNQMQWLLEQLSDALQPADVPMEPLAEPVFRELLADWNALETAWRERDAEVPAFYRLRAVFNALPVAADAAPAGHETSTADGGKDGEADIGGIGEADHAGDVSRAGRVDGTNGLDHANGADAIAERTDKHDSVKAVPTIGKHAQALATQAQPALSSDQPALPAIVPPASPASGDIPAAGDPEALADTGLSHLRPLIDWCLVQHPALPLLFRLNRICAWTTLEQLPPSQNGTTRLPPPSDQLLVSHEQIVQAGDAQAAMQFAESRLIAYRYWLDLNHTSHAALIRMGAAQAAATVAFETNRMLARLPGLAELRFSDGRPFASAATQAWLRALDASSASAAGDIDELSGLVQAAQTDATNGRLTAALNTLQTAAQRMRGRRDQFRLQLAQCSLVQRFDEHIDTRPLLHPLIDALDAHGLGTWEPALASQALQLAATAEQRHGTAAAATNHSMLARLASLDLRAAWQLSQSLTTA